MQCKACFSNGLADALACLIAAKCNGRGSDTCTVMTASATQTSSRTLLIPLCLTQRLLLQGPATELLEVSVKQAPALYQCTGGDVWQRCHDFTGGEASFLRYCCILVASAKAMLQSQAHALHSSAEMLQSCFSVIRAAQRGRLCTHTLRHFRCFVQSGAESCLQSSLTANLAKSCHVVS